MADDNNIKTFTASDIEKYHRGQLSPKEMHALEKAALEDPFLADALEGYATPGVSVAEDITELKRRLREKSSKAKVVPIHKAGGSFPWLRAAVIIVLIAGAGLLSYEFLLKNKSEDNAIANAPIAKETDKASVADSSAKDLASQPVDKPSVTVSSEDAIGNVTPKAEDRSQRTIEENQNKREAADSNYGPAAGKTSPVAVAPTQAEKETKTDNQKPNNAAPPLAYDEISAASAEKQKDLAKRPDVQKNANAGELRDKSPEMNVMVGYGAKKAEAPYRTNVFNGRVMDLNNNALPFANITNTRDNVGTYSDAQGNFILISPDSVLNVQVKSIGFENNYAQLRSSSGLNRVLMQEDKSLDAWVIDTVKRNLSQLRKNTLSIEEPEPEDGWESYGTYVANNIHVPETFRKNGIDNFDNTVEVSFEVNKYGEPVNLKVEKSLCDKCDKEAVRLIKEGPKWKRKAKKSKRTTVKVPFVNP